MSGLTPMMKQYYSIKALHPEAILFFRLGDFYEMFAEDALKAVEILGITLTARSKGEDKIAMCGVPYHSASKYIAALNQAGKKVAICEQVSDPNLPGIVQREVVKIITPGTTLDENILEGKSANYLAAVTQKALLLFDLSTGENLAIEVNDWSEVRRELNKYQPREIVVRDLEKSAGLVWSNGYQPVISEFSVDHSIERSRDAVESFDHQNALTVEEKEMLDLGLAYLAYTQKTELGHFRKVVKIRQADYLPLDEATIRNLELIQSLRDKTTVGSLISVLDKTVTNAGSRLLKSVILKPLKDLQQIGKRQDLIQFFLGNQNLMLDTREKLKKCGDIERILARLSLASGNARDLNQLKNAIGLAAEIKQMLAEPRAEVVFELLEGMADLSGLENLLAKAIVEEPPLLIKEGGMIRMGFDSELDRLREICGGGRTFIQEMQAREIARTGINSLKIKFNKVFGYYIEISNSNLKQVPENYVRKQTLVNAERFTTDELKEYEITVLSAEEKIFELEQKIFEQLRQTVISEIAALTLMARKLAEIDLFSSQAIVAWENRYCRPELHEGLELKILAGRHPVIEKLNPTDLFIANDLILDESEKLMLITGPNMGGKSTFLRQNALIVLMAHLGFFVPAESALIPLTDRVFTRVGASDNLVRGQSTFWLEMEETAQILAGASERSLIILDEIGRGTSTFDGLSLAWAIFEYIHFQIGAKTLFASHYHELIAVAEQLPKAVNYSVQVAENEQGVTFLYRIARGGIDQSYGLEVAKLAGLPRAVLQRAQEILLDLESEEKNTPLFTGNPGFGVNSSRETQQLTLIEPEDRTHRDLKEQLNKLNLEEMTPLQALLKLEELKNTFNRE